MKTFENILIVRTDRIGDVILTTPAIKALREAYPQAHISLLVNPLTRDLINKNPSLDEVLTDERNDRHKGFLGFWRLVKDIRSRRFDLAVIFHTKRRTNWLCFLAGIPRRLGYKNNKAGFLLTIPVKDERHLGHKHESDYCLQLLEPLGVKTNEKSLHISLQDEGEAFAADFYTKYHLKPGDKLVAVHMGASDPSKQWPVEYFSELIDQMRHKYHCRFVLIGTKETAQLAKEIQKSSSDPLIDVTAQTSLAQLASLLKRCTMLISNDSGPVHIAAGVGTPVVSIFTRNQPGINPERWHPLETRSRTVSIPLDTSVAFKKAGTASLEYRQKIKPAAVLEAVDAVYKLC